MKLFEAVLVASLVFFSGKAVAAEIPALDRNVPGGLKTATFALG